MKDIRKASAYSTEELSDIAKLLAADVRRNGVPTLDTTMSDIESIRREISKHEGVKKQIDQWESELEDQIDKCDCGDRHRATVSHIENSIQEMCECDLVTALYNGAGSFIISPKRWPSSRKVLAYVILAQAVILEKCGSSPTFDTTNGRSKLFGLAHDILGTDEHFIATPLYSELKEGNDQTNELFHGLLISVFNRRPKAADLLKLQLLGHHLGKEMDIKDLSNYSPAVNGGDFQKYIQTEILDHDTKNIMERLNQKSIAKPAAGLSPWIYTGGISSGSDLPSYDDDSFKNIIKGNDPTLEYHLKISGENGAIEEISKKLKAIFDAESVFFLEYQNNNSFTMIGEPSPSIDRNIYNDPAAISAMLGGPYQTIHEDRTIIAIPQYPGGNFKGASIVVTESAPMNSHQWKYLNFFCLHAFNTIYQQERYIPDSKFTYKNSSNGFIELSDKYGAIIPSTFPPSMPKDVKSIEKFAKDDLIRISDWLSKQMRQFRSIRSAGITATDELIEDIGIDQTKKLFQASTTTIADLRTYAQNNLWSETVMELFKESYKFLEDTKTHLMWLAIHSGDCTYQIFTSKGEDIEEEERLLCEIFAKWTALQNRNIFVPHRSPDLITRLLNKYIGDYSYASIPVYAEQDIYEEDPGDWRKFPAHSVGNFVMVMDKRAKGPSNIEWKEWCMFIPRIYQIMLTASESGKLKFNDTSRITDFWSSENYVKNFRL